MLAAFPAIAMVGKKAAKTPTKKAAKKAAPTKASAKKAAAARPAPRADKGEGEAAVQARIATLAEPSRSILARLHPLIMKHGPSLTPTVKWGFAVYTKDGAMVLVAAPRKKHVSFGYTMDTGLDAEPITYESADAIDEKKVAAIVKRVA